MARDPVCGLTLAVLVAACSAGGDGGARDSRRQATWEDHSETCTRTLRASVRGKQGARASALGVTAEMDARSVADLVIPEAAVGDADTLTVEVDEAGAKRTEQLRIPAKLDWPAHRVLPPGARGTWLGKVEVKLDGQTTSYYAHVPFGDDGVLRVPLPCGTTGGTSEHGEIARGDSGPVLAASALASITARSKISSKDRIALTAKVELAGRGAAEVEATGPMPFETVAAGVRKVREAPLAWAAEYAKGKQQPVLIAYPDRLDFGLVGDAALRDVAAIALVSPVNDYLGQCGPFEELRSGGKKGIMAPHIATHAAVTVVEARTGREIAATTIKNRSKKCPDALVVEGYDEPTAAHPLPSADVAKWVRKAVR